VLREILRPDRWWRLKLCVHFTALTLIDGGRSDIWPVKYPVLQSFSSGTGGGGGPKVQWTDPGSPGKMAI